MQEIKYKLIPKSGTMDSIHLSELSKKFGEEIAHNDFEVEFIALYPDVVADKNGRVVKIDKPSMERIVDANNKAIDTKINHPINKIKRGFRSVTPETLDYVPIIKNHNTGDVDLVTGYSRGKFQLSEVDGSPLLTMRALITDDETKYKIKKGLIKNVSVGIRKDWTLKEVSFVTNPALEHASLLSENENLDVAFNTSENKTLFAQFSENSCELSELSERIDETNERIEQVQIELAEIDKEHHIEDKLDYLVRCGKILPRSVDYVKTKVINLSESDAMDVLSAFELSTPGNMFGVTHNRNFNFQELGDILMTKESSEFASAITALNSKYNKKHKATTELSSNDKVIQFGEGAVPKDKLPADTSKVSLSQEEYRAKLKEHKELSEKDPDKAKKWLSKELGEDEETPSDNKELGEKEKQEKEKKEKEEKELKEKELSELKSQVTELSESVKTITKQNMELLTSLAKLNSEEK